MSPLARRAVRLSLVVPSAVAVGLVLQRILMATIFGPTAPDNVAEGSSTGDLAEARQPTVVATDLTVPWEIRFLPDGDLLVGERRGRLVRLGPDGARSVQQPEPAAPLPQADAAGVG